MKIFSIFVFWVFALPITKAQGVWIEEESSAIIGTDGGGRLLSLATEE